MISNFIVRASGRRRRLRPGENYKLNPGDRLMSFAEKEVLRRCSNCGKHSVAEST